MALVQSLISQDKYSIKCPYTMTPKGICIHNTANDASAVNEISYMKSNSNSTSFHIAIDDVQAIQGIPFNRNAFAAGDGGNGDGNRNYIHVEICYSLSGGSRFTEAEKRAAKEIALLLKSYGWTIKNVKKHQDFSGKYCPHRTLDNGYQRFLNMIQAELDILNKPVEVKPSGIIYRIRKTWTDASSQKGAFSNLDNAKKECDKYSGYSVFDEKGTIVYPIKVTTPVAPTSNKKYLNLKPHVASWRVYKTNVVAKVGNECGFLSPSRYKGLSYEIIRQNGDVCIIKTQSYGEVQIYAPRDNDSTITTTPTYQ